VLEKAGDDAVKAEIVVRMGAMPMIQHRRDHREDEAAHRALMTVKSREAGGRARERDRRVRCPTAAGHCTPTRRSPAGPSMGGVVHGVDALINDFTGKPPSLMAWITMRAVRPGECRRMAAPPSRGHNCPVFSANGPDDYVCVSGNVLATSMSESQMMLGPSIRALQDGQRRDHRHQGRRSVRQRAATNGNHRGAGLVTTGGGGTQRVPRLLVPVSAAASCGRRAAPGAVPTFHHGLSRVSGSRVRHVCQ
jgi:hypothetical protein